MAAALRAAADKGDIAEVSRLLEVQDAATLRKIINSQDSETDLAPLTLAAAGGHQNCVAALLAARANPDLSVEDAGNRTALHMAAYDAHVEVAQLLLEARADACLMSSGGTPSDIVSQRAKEWRIGGGDGEEDIDRLNKILALLSGADR
ncbi:unnamed protein product [Durusdinium trenchii]|uniref:Uncharacterized protein n=2 Tax=Durusdinium trenchii TaxID=1381693 RepID=A0ABP0MBB1_9DINO